MAADPQLLSMAHWLLDRHPNIPATAEHLALAIEKWIDNEFEFEREGELWGMVVSKREGTSCDDLAEYILRSCPLTPDSQTSIAISIQDYKDKIECGDEESE